MGELRSHIDDWMAFYNHRRKQHEGQDGDCSWKGSSPSTSPFQARSKHKHPPPEPVSTRRAIYWQQKRAHFILSICPASFPLGARASC